MDSTQIYEGTAQEIADQIRDSNLSGKLKAILVPEPTPSDEQNQSVADLLVDFFAEVDAIEFVPGKPLQNPRKQELRQLIERKFTAQGHNK